jgi:chromosome segregation ATPase
LSVKEPSDSVSSNEGPAANRTCRGPWLRNEIETLQQEHDRFMQGLSEEQRAALQERIRKMDQACDRIHTQSQQTDQEMSQANPEAQRIGAQAREMEKVANDWRKQYRSLGSEVGISQ